VNERDIQMTVGVKYNVGHVTITHTHTRELWVSIRRSRDQVLRWRQRVIKCLPAITRLQQDDGVVPAEMGLGVGGHGCSTTASIIQAVTMAIHVRPPDARLKAWCM
jgi:hypothetical protein